MFIFNKNNYVLDFFLNILQRKNSRIIVFILI